MSKIHNKFQDADYFSPKILIRHTGDTIIAAHDDKYLLCLNYLHVGNLINADYDFKYVLACLNSTVLNHYYHLVNLEFGRAMAQTDIETLQLLPIKRASKKQRNEIVSLVDNIFILNKELNSAKKEDGATVIQGKIDKVDEGINDKI